MLEAIARAAAFARTLREEGRMQPNEKLVRDFIAAWSRLDRTKAGTKAVDLPCTGAFMATHQRATT